MAPSIIISVRLISYVGVGQTRVRSRWPGSTDQDGIFGVKQLTGRVRGWLVLDAAILAVICTFDEVGQSVDDQRVRN